MILCSCTASTDQNLRDQLRAGVRNVDQLGEACGAGACCGTCRPLLEAFIAQNGGDGGALGGPAPSSAGLNVHQSQDDSAEAEGPPIASAQTGIWPRVS